MSQPGLPSAKNELVTIYIYYLLYYTVLSHNLQPCILQALDLLPWASHTAHNLWPYLFVLSCLWRGWLGDGGSKPSEHRGMHTHSIQRPRNIFDQVFVTLTNPSDDLIQSTRSFMACLPYNFFQLSKLLINSALIFIKHCLQMFQTRTV